MSCDQDGELTGQDGASLALLLHVAVLLPRESERRLEHEAADVVMPLEVGPLVLLLLLVEVGHHVRHLDVRKLGVQVFGIYLFQNKKSSERMSTNSPRTGNHNQMA